MIFLCPSLLFFILFYTPPPHTNKDLFWFHIFFSADKIAVKQNNSTEILWYSRLLWNLFTKVTNNFISLPITSIPNFLLQIYFNNGLSLASFYFWWTLASSKYTSFFIGNFHIFTVYSYQIIYWYTTVLDNKNCYNFFNLHSFKAFLSATRKAGSKNYLKLNWKGAASIRII